MTFELSITQSMVLVFSACGLGVLAAGLGLAVAWIVEGCRRPERLSEDLQGQRS